jgi:hypothetical protein
MEVLAAGSADSAATVTERKDSSLLGEVMAKMQRPRGLAFC